VVFGLPQAIAVVKSTGTTLGGLAQLVCTGWFKPAHIKSEESLWLRLLLTHRRTLKRKMLDVENEVRHSVKVFGIRLGSGFGYAAFARRVRATLADDAFLLGLTECMLHAWGAVGRVQPAPQIAGQSDAAGRAAPGLLAISWVGPVTALTFKSGVDEPLRFRRSTTVGTPFTPTPHRIRSPANGR
jgi:transposase